MNKTFVLLCGLLVLSACSASDQQEAPAPLANLAPPPYVVNSPGDGTAQREAMNVLTRSEAVERALSPRAPLDVAEAEAQASLAQAGTLSAGGASALRQIVASEMLPRHLAAPEPDEDAVARYTQILIDNDSPNAHLLSASLTTLKPTWGAARVHAAAAKAVTEANEYLGKTCSGCNDAALRGSPLPESEASSTDIQRQVQTGVAALEAL